MGPSRSCAEGVSQPLRAPGLRGARPRRRRPARAAGRLLGGGTQGNEQLTALTGALLILLLAALGVTILRIRELIGVHLLLGFLLLGPLALKLASTGYRFARYYTRSPPYRRKGPPLLALRLLAPLVVASTLVVFASGIVLLFEGPASRGTWLLIHKASFIAWLGVTALHVLGHLPETAAALRIDVRPGWRIEPLRPQGGSVGRWISLAGALAGGVVLALLLAPHFGAWTAPGAFPHHRDR